MLKFLLFVFILCKICEAYVGIYPPEEKPEKYADQEGCYLSNLQKVLPVGVPYSPQDGTTCEEYICMDSQATHVFGCGVKAVTENCEAVPGNLSLPYPDCCGRVRCTQPDGSVVLY